MVKKMPQKTITHEKADAPYMQRRQPRHYYLNLNK